MTTLIFADIKCGFVKNGSHKDTLIRGQCFEYNLLDPLKNEIHEN